MHHAHHQILQRHLETHASEPYENRMVIPSDPVTAIDNGLPSANEPEYSIFVICVVPASYDCVTWVTLLPL